MKSTFWMTAQEAEKEIKDREKVAERVKMVQVEVKRPISVSIREGNYVQHIGPGPYPEI